MRKKNKLQKISYFKRWTRKGYAIFFSLNKVVSISTIALGCSFLSKPVAAQSSVDSLPQKLEEVRVTVEEDPETLTLDKMFLQVALTRSEIERVPVQALSELLDQLPGLDVRQRGPLGVQADLSYRGGNFDQTMVLLNGINVTDPQTGHYTMNLPVHPGIIRKIELYNNTTAFLFGASPFSGLVNIITRPENKNSLSFHLTGGMHGLISTGAALNLRTGKVRHLLSADYNKSNGYRHNTDFEIGNVFYQLLGDFGKDELEFQVGYQNKQYGANGFYSLRFPDQYEYLQTLIASVKWNHKGRVAWSPSVYYRMNRDHFELIKGQDPRKNNYHINQVAGVNFQMAFRTLIGRTSFGLDGRLEDILSTSLGELLKNPVPTKIDSVDYTNRRTRGNLGVSASHHYDYKGLSADLTLLLQYYTDIKKKLYLFLAASVSYTFTPQSVGQNFITEKITLSGSGTMRMPTFTDLYYKTGDIRGNSELLPEKAYTIELDMGFGISKEKNLLPFFFGNITIFNRWGIDMIDYVKEDNELIWNTVNHTSVIFTGLEVAFEYRPGRHLNPDFFIHSIGIHYSFLSSDKDSKGYQSRYVLDHLRHRLSAKLSHRIYKGLALDYAFSFNQRKGEYTSYKEDATGILARYPNYALLDLKLHYTYKILNVYVEASNLLNQHYFDLGDLEQPGIWVKIGIKSKFNF